MRFVMNALDEDQTVMVGGKHFSFKGKQIKPFQNDDVADVILKLKAELGFVEIPKLKTDDDSLVDDYDRSPAGLELVESKRKEGIENYCRRLKAIVYNLQVSLRKDLAVKNMNIEPSHLASDGDLKHMEQLAKYQTRKEDAAQVRADKIKKLEKQLKD